MTKSGTAPASRPLSEVARHVVAPAGVVSTRWPRVRDTCRRLGWRFDGWQDGAGRLILARTGDGQYAADTTLISIPRQAGKTYLVACIIFALCLTFPGLTVIWTAHRKTTARETFDQFDGMAQRPRVAAHIRQVLRGRGEEKILFDNGSRILFGARESGFGRGFAGVDILVCDEGQILPESTLEDLGATQNTAPDPLFFLMGTPPRPKDPGEYFIALRREALDGESEGTLYIETSADRGGDPLDPERIAQANPSYPHRTSHRAMLRLRKKLKNDDAWNREALGIHDDTRHVVISKAAWNDLRSEGPATDVEPDAFGVDMSHDRQISIAACWATDTGHHVEEVWAGHDTAAAVEWLTTASRRRPIVIDNMSPAAALIPEFKARRRNVVATTAGDMVKACGMVEDRVNNQTVSHGDQASIDDALAGAKKRDIRDAGGWGWDRSDPAKPIHPLVAATLSLFGAVTRKRRAGERRVRKAVIG